MVEWGNYAEAYKGIHDKLDEILTKLDYPSDPAIQDVIDRTDRLLGRVYGSQGQQLKQRAGTYELMVQLVHQGTEYQAGGGAGGLVQCQIRNAADDAWVNEPYARDVSDRATRLLGIIYGDVGQLLQRPTTKDLLIQLRHAGTEIDPRQIRALTSSDVVDISDRATRALGNIADVIKVATRKPFSITFTAAGDSSVWAPATGKKVRVKGFQFSTSADIEVGLRFGTTETKWATLQSKGVLAMNFIGCNIEGAVDEVLNCRAEGAVTVKGFILGEEI